MSRRVGSRALAVTGLAAAVAAGTAAVVSALGAPSAEVTQADAAGAAHTVRFGSARVVATSAGARTCFRVERGKSTLSHACVNPVGADEIAYASSPRALGGIAGTDVRAVIVKLTRKGTVWATLRRGAFYAAVPRAYGVRAVVKVLRDGSRRTFTVTATR